MSVTDYTTKLLDLDDVDITECRETATEIRLLFSLKRKPHTCPNCHGSTNRIHDYRLCVVRDLELRGKPLTLLYRKRRYSCPCCGKRFAEHCSFAGRYQRFTCRVALHILDLLHQRISMKDIARLSGTSVSAVHRCMKLLPDGKPSLLPAAISFDEFKGNAGGERFQCIVTDPMNHRVLDILPDRSVSTIQDYLLSFPNRSEVQYAVMDMNRGFRDAARTFLPNATIVIDRFHVVRYCTQAMDNARRSLQNHLPKEQRKYFKRSRRLLLAHREKLSEDDKEAIDVMLRFSDHLAQAYALKEHFYWFMAAPDRQEAERRLKQWFNACDRLNLPEFRDCRKMLRNWQPYILNAFTIRLSNGFTEGCNNAIKALKRVSFGLPDFHVLRARILASFSPHPNI